MSNLVRWNPIRDMVSMSDAMDRLFDEAFIFPRNGGTRFGNPTLDVVEQDDTLIVKAELPGFKPEQVDVRVEGNTLTLRGEIDEEKEREEGQYRVRERQHSSFARSVTLPVVVDTEKAKAEFENGVLTLTLPKHELAMPKRISITAKSGK